MEVRNILSLDYVINRKSSQFSIFLLEIFSLNLSPGCLSVHMSGPRHIVQTIMQHRICSQLYKPEEIPTFRPLIFFKPIFLFLFIETFSISLTARFD